MLHAGTLDAGRASSSTKHRQKAVKLQCNFTLALDNKYSRNLTIIVSCNLPVNQ